MKNDKDEGLNTEMRIEEGLSSETVAEVETRANPKLDCKNTRNIVLLERINMKAKVKAKMRLQSSLRNFVSTVPLVSMYDVDPKERWILDIMWILKILVQSNKLVMMVQSK